MIYLDTHVVAWLYAGQLANLPPAVHKTLDSNELLVSPMVVLELQYLHEIGRLSEPAESVMAALGTEIGLRVCDLPFPLVAGAALSESWTRDPFDRIIVSQAKLSDRQLISKDRHIHEHYPKAVWE